MFYKILKHGTQCHSKRVTTIVSDLRIHRTLGSTAIRQSANISGEVYQQRDVEYKKSMIRNANGPTLKDFIAQSSQTVATSPSKITTPDIPYVKNIDAQKQTVYYDIYGCQMNVNDVEVIQSILKPHGYTRTQDLITADIVLVITCSIRDSAESKVWSRIQHLNSLRSKKKGLNSSTMKIGLLGCMAERLKHKIVEKEKLVDVIAGPDSYRDLPRLLAITDNETAINVALSFDETYADITPVRLNPDAISAFVTIMRGCDNMCTYCIVPFTRGRERSRPVISILDEIQKLSDEGIKEVTLLGQNVNSYRDLSQSNFYVPNGMETHLVKGFKTTYKNKKGGLRFSDLLDKVSLINPEMRIRFTSPHPKDFPDEVLQLIAERPNVCRHMHVPAQSGNSAVLDRMRRGYTREAYLDLIHHIRDIIPDVSLSTDFIAGFCGETDEEFKDTLSLIKLVKYNIAFLFAYSMREKTTAHRRYKDDVEQSVKLKRLREMIELHYSQSEKLNSLKIGEQQLVLVDGISRKGEMYLQGRNDGNMRVLLPPMEVPTHRYSKSTKKIECGDYVVVYVCYANSTTLTGVPLYHSTIREFSSSEVENKCVQLVN